MFKLMAAAEECKHVLSTLNTAHCFVESLHEGVDLSANVSRARIDMLIAQLFPSFIGPIGEVLEQAGLTAADVHKVIDDSLTNIIRHLPITKVHRLLFVEEQLKCPDFNKPFRMLYPAVKCFQIWQLTKWWLSAAVIKQLWWENLGMSPVSTDKFQCQQLEKEFPSV